MGKSKDLATRVGIDDNADATAITITSQENVGIGTASPSNYGAAYTSLGVSGSSASAIEGFVGSNLVGYLQAYNTAVLVGSKTNVPLKLVTNDTIQMTIDGSGRVTKPQQPSFAAYVQNNHTGYDANSVGNAYVNYDAELYDTGNNHSAGIFTAPVAGVYYFRAEAYTNNYCTQSWFIVNGSRTNASDTVYTGNDSFSGNSTILKLAANDTVGFHPYRAGYNSITVNANANHSWFRGMLIG